VIGVFDSGHGGMTVLRAPAQFLTTGNPAAVSALAKRFFGAGLRFQKV